MKVHNSNNNIFMGDNAKSHRNQKTEENNKQNKRSTIFVGDLNLPTDKITQKRQEAQQKALKVVRDAYAGEKKIDDDLDKRRSKIDSLKSEADEAQKELNKLEERKNELKISYGITNEIDAMGKTEYQQSSLELDAAGAPYRKVIEENKNSIINENHTITGIKLERVKTHPMVDATKTADSILEAASNEIKGMLLDEAKEHIDEQLAKGQEEAEKKAEEEKKQEEELAAVKAKREEIEALTDNKPTATDNKNNATTELPTEQLLNQDSVKNEIELGIQDILNKMNLVAEDIKGAAVDTII